mmetsp:Transcript_739/g.1182  ORF Transcript_739/g.1182 Transcript_739/m.1182 type:complete len:100 (+) Transcript_739:545-844(+)
MAAQEDLLLPLLGLQAAAAVGVGKNGAEALMMAKPGLNQISTTSTEPNITTAVAVANMRSPQGNRLIVDDTQSTVNAAPPPLIAVIHPLFPPVGQENLY